jgi:hypothetical protein
MSLLVRASLLVAMVLVAASAALPQAREVRPIFRPLQIAGRAGVIFAGRVVALQYEKPHAPGEVGAMRITFQVERGLRGVRSGSQLTIREWEGLWNSGERYRVGERLVLFLYPNSKLGLTSPVGGTRGRLAINASGEVVMGAEQALSLFDHPLGSKAENRMSVRDFAHAVRRASAQEK